MNTEYVYMTNLRSYLKRIGKKQENIATELDVTQQYISALLSGTRPINQKIAAKISALYGISYVWLLTGQGEMLDNPSDKVQPNNKKERVNKAFNYLIVQGIVKTQKELAERMDYYATNLSNALKGDERYLTDKFIARFNASVDNIFSSGWLLTGEGEMLASPPPTQQNDGSNNNNVIGDNNTVWNTYDNTYAHAHTRANNNIEEAETIEDARPIIPKSIASLPNTDVYEFVKTKQIANLTMLRTLPPYQDFDFYYQVRQDAMQPIYMQGDVLALAHIAKGSDIIQGAIMVIDTTDCGFLLRRLYDRGDAYECKIINQQSAFENQMVSKDKVIRLYKVVYSLRLGD